MSQISLSDCDGRSRQLPTGLAGALRQVPSRFDLDLLSRLAGFFVEGYTSEAICEAGSVIQKAVGLPLVAVWGYVDFMTGGDSDCYLLDGEFYPLPASLSALLFDGEPVDPEQLEIEIACLRHHRFERDPIQVDFFNYALQDRR